MADQKLAKQFNALSEDSAAGNGKINPATPQGALPSQVGRALESESVSAGGGGIASPLTETSRTTETVTLTDSTGLIRFDVEAAKQITMRDSSSADVVFNYEIPAP